MMLGFEFAPAGVGSALAGVVRSLPMIAVLIVVVLIVAWAVAGALIARSRRRGQRPQRAVSLGARWHRRTPLASRCADWAEVMGLLSDGLRAGRPLYQSLCVCADHGPPNLSPAMSRFKELAESVEVAQALEMVRVESADPLTAWAFDVLAEVEGNQSAVGAALLGSLADALEAHPEWWRRVEREGSGWPPRRSIRWFPRAKARGISDRVETFAPHLRRRLAGSVAASAAVLGTGAIRRGWLRGRRTERQHRRSMEADVGFVIGCLRAQLLAGRSRCGAVNSLPAVCAGGALVAELAWAEQQIRQGVSVAASYGTLAEASPGGMAGRLFRTLARAEHGGFDLETSLPRTGSDREASLPGRRVELAA